MQFFKLLLSSTLLLSTVYGQLNCKDIGGDVKNCGNSRDILQLSEFSINPSEPRKGEEVNVRVRGKLSETIRSGAKLDYVIRRNLLVVRTGQLDICDALAERKAKIQCPIQAQDFDVNETFNIPQRVPRGRYSLIASARQGSKQIFNVQGGIRIR